MSEPVRYWNAPLAPVPDLDAGFRNADAQQYKKGTLSDLMSCDMLKEMIGVNL